MVTLVVGASGATGRLLVEQLLDRGEKVRIIVRTPNNLPLNLTSHKNLSVVCASVLDLDDKALVEHVSGCNAVASCLGHNLTFKGMFGAPRKLVSDATRRLCNAIKSNPSNSSIKVVLMNTAGNSNRDLDEKISFGQRCVIGLLRLLLPPHVDNESAAEFLRAQIGQRDEAIEWAVVRPDGLTDEAKVTEFVVHPSPIRSAIFDAGKTSRINVGCFMADLICDDDTWSRWKGKMPVIYNLESDAKGVKDT